MFKDHIKIFAENEKELTIYKNLLLRFRNGIKNRKMLHAKKGKKKRRIELPNQENIRTLGENEIMKIKWNKNLRSRHIQENGCDTIWLVHQADDLFVCFGAKPKQRAWTRDLPCNRKWRRKGRSEKRQGELTKEPREGSRQRTAEETSRREIAVQGKDGQQKEAVREDSQRWVDIRSGFCRSFAKNTRPP